MLKTYSVKWGQHVIQCSEISREATLGGGVTTLIQLSLRGGTKGGIIFFVVGLYINIYSSPCFLFFFFNASPCSRKLFQHTWPCHFIVKVKSSTCLPCSWNRAITTWPTGLAWSSMGTLAFLLMLAHILLLPPLDLCPCWFSPENALHSPALTPG